MQVNPFPFKRAVRIEMVPLIDCFFLLLTFFIFGVFYTTMQQGIVVDLPHAETAASSNEETLTISMEADGAMFVNRDAVTQETLAVRLRDTYAQQPKTLILINADQQVPHGTVIRVLDAVRRTGFPRVSFQAKRDESL